MFTKFLTSKIICLPINILNQRTVAKIESLYRKEKRPFSFYLEFLDKNFSRDQLDRFILNLLRRKIPFKIAPPPLCFFNFQYSKILKDNLRVNGLPIYFKETLISNRSSLAGIKNTGLFFQCRQCNLYQKKCGGIFAKGFNKEAVQKINEFNNLLRNFLNGSYQKNILDIGCGFPSRLERYIELAKKQKHKFLCIDPDESKIRSLKIFIQKRKSTNLVRAQTGVCEHLKSPSQYFDVVLMFNAYNHLSNLPQSLKEIRRVLKPKGWLFLNSVFQKFRSERALPLDHINNHNLFLAQKTIKKSHFKIVYSNFFKSKNEEYWYIIGKRSE